jgi:hypothetical protein
MKFFVPYFRGKREMAEYVWLRARACLRENGLDTTRRRIQALVAEIDGADHYIAVDHEEPFGGDIALLILESSDRKRIHICTLARGIGDTRPWTLRLGEPWRVVDFEDGASEPGLSGP